MEISAYEYEDMKNTISKLNSVISRLRKTITDLTAENKNLQSLADKQKFTIQTELEPRIQAEKRSYDAYIVNSAQPKCQCVLGCKWEGTDECSKMYDDNGDLVR